MKNTDVYVQHMLECITAIENYYRGVAQPKQIFFDDDKTQQATLHRLQTLGQTAKNLPAPVQQAISPTIDWQAVADFRNVLVHEYLGIDLDIVWNVIERDLAVLKNALFKYKEQKHD